MSFLGCAGTGDFAIDFGRVKKSQEMVKYLMLSLCVMFRQLFPFSGAGVMVLPRARYELL